MQRPEKDLLRVATTLPAKYFTAFRLGPLMLGKAGTASLSVMCLPSYISALGLSKLQLKRPQL